MTVTRPVANNVTTTDIKN